MTHFAESGDDPFAPSNSSLHTNVQVPVGEAVEVGVDCAPEQAMKISSSAMSAGKTRVHFLRNMLDALEINACMTGTVVLNKQELH
jgi:hypothetical protein